MCTMFLLIYARYTVGILASGHPFYNVLGCLHAASCEFAYISSFNIRMIRKVLLTLALFVMLSGENAVTM